MTSHEPEDGTRPGDEDPAETSPAGPARRAQLPADVDAAFAAIVADWVAADAPHWPADGGAADGSTDGSTDGTTGLSSGVGLATPPDGTPGPGPVAPGPGPHPPAAERPRDRRPDTDRRLDRHPDRPAEPWRGPTGPDRDDPEDHYVPPEPPPLPRVGLSSLAGLLLIVVGVVLLAVPGLIGGAIGLGIVPGLVAMTAGLGWLVVGMRRPSERDGSGPDDAGEV